MDMMSTEYGQLVKLAQDMESVETVQKEIANKNAERQNRLAAKKRIALLHPDQKTFPRTHSRAYLSEVRDRASKEYEAKKDNLRICAIGISLLVSLVLAGLLIYFGINWLAKTREVFLDHWWVPIWKQPELKVFSYHIAVTIWLALMTAGIGFVFLAFSSDDPNGWHAIPFICGIGAAVIVLIAGISPIAAHGGDGVLVVVFWIIAFPIAGIFQWIIWGFVATLPCVLFILASWMPYVGYRLGNVIANMLGCDTLPDTSNAEKKAKKTSAYKKAEWMDMQDAAAALVKYEKEYTDCLVEIENHNHAIDCEIVAIDRETQKYGEILRVFQKAVSDNPCLTASDKTREMVQRVLYFMSTGRADTIKEALQQADQARYFNELLKGMTTISMQLEQIAAQNAQISWQLGTIATQNAQISHQLAQMRTDVNNQLTAARREAKEIAEQQRKSAEAIRQEVVTSRQVATKKAEEIKKAIDSAASSIQISMQKAAISVIEDSVPAAQSIATRMIWD